MIPKNIKKSILAKLKQEYARLDNRHTVNEFPQNWLQGRTSDYHTATGTTKRKNYGNTNFKKTNSGHPDLDDENEEDNE